MAQGFVQAVSGAVNLIAAGSSCSVVNSGAPQGLSDFIIATVVQGPLVVGGGYASISEVIDIANGPYTYLTGITNSMTTLRQSLYYCQNTAPCLQNANTITAYFSAPSTNIYIRFVEFTGVAISGLPLDISTTASGHNNIPIIGPITPPSVGDLLFSCCSVIPSGSLMTGAGSGWTLAGLDTLGSVDQYILNAPIQAYTGAFAGPNQTAWVATIVGLINAGQGNSQLATVNISAGLTMPASSKLVYGGIVPAQMKAGVTPKANVIMSAIASI